MNKRMKKFVRYIRRTYKNKICAIAVISGGILSTAILNDATFLVFTLMIGIPMFFTKRNCFI